MSGSTARGNFELTTKTGAEGCGDGMRAGEITHGKRPQRAAKPASTAKTATT